MFVALKRDLLVTTKTLHQVDPAHEVTFLVLRGNAQEKAPENFWACKGILDSFVSKNREVYMPKTSCMKRTSVPIKNM